MSSRIETEATKATICSKSERVIKLNVGGSSFCTTISTLTASPYFEKLFKNEDDIEILKNREIYIDRDGDLFSDILEYLRSYKVYNVNLKELKVEAEFYQLKDMTHALDVMLREQKIGKRREFELVSLHDLSKIACLNGEDDKCLRKSLSQTYEFISVVKYSQQKWYCEKHGAQHPLESCQRNNWVCPTRFRFDKGQEQMMLLVAKLDE